MNKFAVLSESEEDFKSDEGDLNEDNPEEDVLATNEKSYSVLGANEIEGIDPASWNIRGMCQVDKQKEVAKFIKDEHLCMCAVIETHLKPGNINKACQNVFKHWNWASNVVLSPNSCRIIVGWNNNVINSMILQVDRQVILCLVESIDKKIKFYCSYVYGSNSGKERKSTLKKLDRIMCNNDFFSTYPQARGIFLPYMVSDHSPSLLNIPNCLVKRKRSFRFMNHVTCKDEFLSVVEQAWKEQVVGHKMFQVVTKLKKLKKKFNSLNWNNGNVFSKVTEMKDRLRKCQDAIDKNPHDHQSRVAAVNALNDYEKQNKKSLFCCSRRLKFSGDLVADQFVDHFQKFLGDNGKCIPLQRMGNIFENKLSNEESIAMVGPVTDEEVKSALFDIDDNKASGPDGYSSLFFKKAWNIVDDLLVFCHGDEFSVSVIKKGLDDFGLVSGLVPNLKITNLLQFSVGKLPMKYLGVPLLAKKLGIQDCKSLINKIKKKVLNWKNRKLSYAGRLQLVASVLSYMQNYWASVYILPCGVIDDIDRILKTFLWCQDGSLKGRAKVAWKDVCLPKDQGRLGLKPLKEWNETFVVKNLWRIFTQSDSLWSKWLRDKIKPHIHVKHNLYSDDEYLWITNGGTVVKFSTHQVWSDFRSNSNKVD
ncbi:uncharacterized protein [Rutidosis leptorrhynchoides]|uniref:uncharacterized protein n=1 Tax=Rutidosis leptorrhynchoides TaxID=125765 RepID=UPI003A99202F